MLLTNASHHYPSIGWAVCKAHLISASPLQQSLETSDFTARPHHIYVSESTSRVPYVTPKGDNEPKLSTQTLPLLVQKPCQALPQSSWIPRPTALARGKHAACQHWIGVAQRGWAICLGPKSWKMPGVLWRPSTFFPMSEVLTVSGITIQ